MSTPEPLQSPLSLAEAEAILASERDYQLLRWGARQEDGTFKGVDHHDSDYVLYIGHYNEKTAATTATSPDYPVAMEAVRKVGALVVARFEQAGVNRKSLLDTLPSVYEPRSVEQTAIRIRGSVRLAENLVAQHNIPGASIDNQLKDILAHAVRCIRKYGCPKRNLEGIINARDEQPASLPEPAAA